MFLLLVQPVFSTPLRPYHTVKKTVVRSKLSLVDLAGSERLAKTEATGDRLKEALHINKSLSALGDVVASLTSRKGHVPFRNSKLTHLLSDSLGADCKTLLFVNSSPAATSVSESTCSLMFASRARNVDLSSSGTGAAGAVARWDIQKRSRRLFLREFIFMFKCFGWLLLWVVFAKKCTPQNSRRALINFFASSSLF